MITNFLTFILVLCIALGGAYLLFMGGFLLWNSDPAIFDRYGVAGVFVFAVLGLWILMALAVIKDGFFSQSRWV